MATEYFEGTDYRTGGGIASKQMSVVLGATRDRILKAKRTGASVGFGETNSADKDAAREQRLTEFEIEKEWIERVRVDCEAFAFFYVKYRPEIFRYTFSLASDIDVAADLTDEVFFRAIVNLGTYIRQGNFFGAWLKRVAYNLVMQEFRRTRVCCEISFNPDIHDRDNGQRPDRDAELRDEFQILNRCLHNLKPEPRRVIVNHYGRGMTTKEIEAEMGIAEATVKSHLQRGRGQLREQLMASGIYRGLPIDPWQEPGIRPSDMGST